MGIQNYPQQNHAEQEEEEEARPLVNGNPNPPPWENPIDPLDMGIEDQERRQRDENAVVAPQVNQLQANEFREDPFPPFFVDLMQRHLYGLPLWDPLDDGDRNRWFDRLNGLPIRRRNHVLDNQNRPFVLGRPRGGDNEDHSMRELLNPRMEAALLEGPLVPPRSNQQDEPEPFMVFRDNAIVPDFNIPRIFHIPSGSASGGNQDRPIEDGRPQSGDNEVDRMRRRVEAARAPSSILGPPRKPGAFVVYKGTPEHPLPVVPDFDVPRLFQIPSDSRRGDNQTLSIELGTETVHTEDTIVAPSSGSQAEEERNVEGGVNANPHFPLAPMEQPNHDPGEISPPGRFRRLLTGLLARRRRARGNGNDEMNGGASAAGANQNRGNGTGVFQMARVMFALRAVVRALAALTGGLGDSGHNMPQQDNHHHQVHSQHSPRANP